MVSGLCQMLLVTASVTVEIFTNGLRPVKAGWKRGRSVKLDFESRLIDCVSGCQMGTLTIQCIPKILG